MKLDRILLSFSSEGAPPVRCYKETRPPAHGTERMTRARPVGLPAGANDAYPLECEGADGTVMGYLSRVAADNLIRPQ